MKQGRTLTQIAQELERQIDSRRDFVAKQGAIQMREDNYLEGLNGEAMPINNWAHGQIASALGIPKPYYDRMRNEYPSLLKSNVNAWLHDEGDKRRMVRTLDGQVRAFLSDRYRPLDNFDLMRTALPSLQEMNAQVVSSEITERRLYVKAIFPSLCAKIDEGKTWGEGHQFLEKDTLVAAIFLSNSEIGAGTLRVEAGFYKTRCTNLAIFNDSAMKKYHIGRSAVSDLDNAVELFTDETRRQDDKAFWMKVRDVIASSCNKEFFQLQIEKMQAATEDRILTKDLPAVVEVTRKQLGIQDAFKGDILTHLIQGQDLTRWGLLNAVTRTAEDVPSYDVATDLERAGGKILELSKSDWKSISEAA